MAHDLAATRRVRKGVLSGGNGPDTRAGAPAAPHVVPEASTHTPPDVASEPTATLAPLIGERVADVRHEIGNYFHKLYYWADFPAEAGAGAHPTHSPRSEADPRARALQATLSTSGRWRPRRSGCTPARSSTASCASSGAARRPRRAVDRRRAAAGARCSWIWAPPQLLAVPSAASSPPPTAGASSRCGSPRAAGRARRRRSAGTGWRRDDQFHAERGRVGDRGERRAPRRRRALDARRWGPRDDRPHASAT